MTQGKARRRGLLALCLCFALLFTSLGTWQVRRLAWKRDLIARVDERIHAAPVPAPGRSVWAGLDIRAVEYQRVQARGEFLHDRETLVDALTEQGPGFWVLTPLDTVDGTFLVNRGFVPPDRRAVASRSEGQVAGETTVTGLLRASEPVGRILRPNEPKADRWFSRDVMAISSARGLGGVAPFFIDAEATPGSAALPLAGLTVVRFRNAHLPYALTWFALAALCAGGVVVVLRDERRAQRLPG